MFYNKYTIIFYPCYTKYTKKGATTFFKHINFNPKRTDKEGLGAKII